MSGRQVAWRGSDFSLPVSDTTRFTVDLNRIQPSDYYALAKLNAEVKHRALEHLSIVDFRVFGFFSRYADLSAKFFLSDVLTAIRSGRPLVTDSRNMFRDYVHPADLCQLIEKCMERQHLNDAFDVYSRQPAAKFEIIEAIRTRYGLEVEVRDGAIMSNATGSKDHYYSLSRKAETVAYLPQRTSLEAILEELSALV